MKTVVFDFDGVIHDTFDFHLRNVREFFGIDLSAEEFRRVFMGNLFEHFPETLRGRSWDAYSRHVSEEVASMPIVPEVKVLLKRLSESYGLHIITSNSGINVTEFMRRNGLERCFAEILGFEAARSKEEKFATLCSSRNIDPDEMLFVTDTLGDILEARSAGVPTVAIDSGYHDRETLLRGNPEYLISDLSELEGIIAMIDV